MKGVDKDREDVDENAGEDHEVVAVESVEDRTDDENTNDETILYSC